MFKQVKQLLARSEVFPAAERTPIVSIIVIVYDMPSQAQNTILSLYADYQQGVQAGDYEVLIIENASPNLMDAGFIASLPGNVRYILRENPEQSPVQAINFAASQAAGDNICLMIDGARMLTPGVVKNLILGHRLHDRAVVAIPGYHLGKELQQVAVQNGYGIEAERELIASINWPENGYSLFDIACFSGSSAPGFFLPNSESNCISLPRDVWVDLGGYDPRFDLRGGGLTNLDFYKRACEFPGAQHIIVPGEGTFHQFHGGVTTGGEEEKVTEVYRDNSKEQYRKIRGQEYVCPETNPVFLGQFPEQAQRFLHYSSEMRTSNPDWIN
ncbi:MAG: glycosyltransferase [Halioglobus sp.]